jgi:hypothetical protein
VTAMPEQDGTPFAIVSAKHTSGEVCFLVVRGASTGRPICGGLAAPLVVFSARERVPDGTGRLVPATDVIGLARHRIASVVATWKSPEGRQSRQGSAMLPAARFWAFGSRYVGSVPSFTGLDGSGKAVAYLPTSKVTP